MTRNADRHPYRNASSTMVGGARTAPSAAPLLKMPDASARSREGNHSLTTFTPAGQLPASPAPSKNRQAPRLIGPTAKKCKMPAVDQTNMHSAYPNRVPTRSINGPDRPLEIV